MNKRFAKKESAKLRCKKGAILGKKKGAKMYFNYLRGQFEEIGMGWKILIEWGPPLVIFIDFILLSNEILEEMELHHLVGLFIISLLIFFLICWGKWMISKF